VFNMPVRAWNGRKTLTEAYRSFYARTKQPLAANRLLRHQRQTSGSGVDFKATRKPATAFSYLKPQNLPLSDEHRLQKLSGAINTDWRCA
jgi:hypothetical protein